MEVIKDVSQTTRAKAREPSLGLEVEVELKPFQHITIKDAKGLALALSFEQYSAITNMVNGCLQRLQESSLPQGPDVPACEKKRGWPWRK